MCMILVSIHLKAANGDDSLSDLVWMEFFFCFTVLTSCASLLMTPMKKCTRCCSSLSARVVRDLACCDFPFPGDHLGSRLFGARPRFNPLLVLLPFAWAVEAKQRIHVKEFVIQKMSCGLSVSQICHQEFIFSLFLILPLVQCDKAKGLVHLSRRYCTWFPCTLYTHPSVRRWSS